MPTTINININPAIDDYADRRFMPEKEMVLGVDFLLMEGYVSTRAYEERARKKGKAKKGKNCSKGQVCGMSCISKTRTCLQNLSSKEFMAHNKAKREAKRAAKGGGAQGSMMSEAEADKFVQGTAWQDRTFFHGTSQQGADIITTDGIDITKNTSAFYGQGFYMGGTSAQNDGLSIASGYASERPDSQVLEMKVRTKNPLEVTEDEYHAIIRKEVQAGNIPKIRVDMETGTVNSEYMEGVTAHLKSQGYDALYIKGLDYAIAFDPQQVAIYNRFDANNPPKASQDKVKTEQTALLESEI